MIVVYALLVVCGGWFLFESVLGSPNIVYRTMVQAAIMLLIGFGGVVVSLRSREGK